MRSKLSRVEAPGLPADEEEPEPTGEAEDPR